MLHQPGGFGLEIHLVQKYLELKKMYDKRAQETKVVLEMKVVLATKVVPEKTVFQFLRLDWVQVKKIQEVFDLNDVQAS